MKGKTRLLNDINRDWEYTAEDISWAIGEGTEDDFVIKNEVGYKDRISEMPDGEYFFVKSCYDYNDYVKSVEKIMHRKNWISNHKIIVKDGQVDIMSAKRAVADILNQSGNWHYFIEDIWLSEEYHNTLHVALGS